MKSQFLVLIFCCIFFKPNAWAQKSVSEVGSVPTLGQVTEAGVTSPGATSYYSPGAIRNRPGMTAPGGASVYQDSRYTNGDTLSTGYTTALGFLNLFAQASALGNRVAPRAGDAPMFYGECPFCQSRNPATTETAAPSNDINPDGTPTPQAVVEAHDPNLIRAIIDQEDLGAFVGLDEAARQARINDVITSLDPYGGLVFRNTDEYKEMCPNFENLNANQRKAFMVFLYSEIFKVTSAYDNATRTTSDVNGTSVTRVGLCQIEFSEYNRVRRLYAENFSGSSESLTQENFESEYAVNPLNNMMVCSALIFSRTENVATGVKPIRDMFPNVNLSPIADKLKNLKICARAGNGS